MRTVTSEGCESQSNIIKIGSVEVWFLNWSEPQRRPAPGWHRWHLTIRNRPLRTNGSAALPLRTNDSAALDGYESLNHEIEMSRLLACFLLINVFVKFC